MTINDNILMINDNQLIQKIDTRNSFLKMTIRKNGYTRNFFETSNRENKYSRNIYVLGSRK